MYCIDLIFGRSVGRNGQGDNVQWGGGDGRQRHPGDTRKRNAHLKPGPEQLISRGLRWKLFGEKLLLITFLPLF